MSNQERKTIYMKKYCKEIMRVYGEVMKNE